MLKFDENSSPLEKMIEILKYLKKYTNLGDFSKKLEVYFGNE